jgi:hypothetical protein
VVEEVYRVRVAAVFTAHAHLEVGAGAPAAFGPDLDQLTDALDAAWS